MRLYLSSYRLGQYPEKLLEMSGQGRVAIVGNALDFKSDEARRKYEIEVYDPRAEFVAMGMQTQDLDLRLYFDNPQKLRNALRGIDLVWVLGGNAFLLMRALRKSGFPEIIREMLAADIISYGGFSAGAVVATPTLRGIELMDDPAPLADGYPKEVVWEGMGLSISRSFHTTGQNTPKLPRQNKQSRTWRPTGCGTEHYPTEKSLFHRPRNVELGR